MPMTIQELNELNTREQQLSVTQRMEVRRRYDACMSVLNRAFKNKENFLRTHDAIGEKDAKVSKATILLYLTLFFSTLSLLLVSLYFLFIVPAFVFSASFFIQLSSRAILVQQRNLNIMHIHELHNQSFLLDQEWMMYMPSFSLSSLSFEIKDSSQYKENLAIFKRKLVDLVDMDGENFFTGFNIYRD